MTAPLPFTGERFTPEVTGAIWYEHWHRYALASAAAAGKRVLDAACGEGYGSMLLARRAAEVIAIDVDARAIAHARLRYGQQANLRYVQGSCVAVPLAQGSIELIVSFETIEHLSEQDAMLAEFRRVLARDGVLIISSPNKPIYSADAGQVNHFHVRELSREELATMLHSSFPQQAWYGQRVLAHSLLWAEEPPMVPRATALLALADDRVYAPETPAAAMYFVVVCGGPEAVLPELPALSIFDDTAQSLFADYQRALLAEKRLYWDELDARKIAEQRLQELIVAVNDLASARQREQALDGRIVSLEAQLEHIQQTFKPTQEALEQAQRALSHAEARLTYRESWPGWLRWPLSRARQLWQGIGAS